MQKNNAEAVTLTDVLISEALSQRSPRTPDIQAENQALRSLVRQMVNAPEIVMQNLAEIAIDLCQAGTAGVSLLDTINGEAVFRWSVLAGILAPFVGQTTPRNSSPCGICLDQKAPVLFAHPERYFSDLQAAGVAIVEGLILPLIAEDHIFGTIWVVSHDEQRHFDPEDLRIMTSLADLMAAALLLNQRQIQAVLEKNAQLEAEITERKLAESQWQETQRRLEFSLAGASLGVWTYNVSTDEFWADDRAKHLHGHEPHEVHTFAEAGANIHPDDRDRAQAFTNAIQTRSKLQIEYRVIWRDGSVHWIASYGEFMSTDQGEMFYGVVQEISDRKFAAAALRDSEAQLWALIKNLPGGAVFIVDRDLRYRIAEGEALYAAGFQPEDFVGKTLFEALPIELASDYEELYRRALRGESFEHEHTAHDRTFISRGIPLRSERGEIDTVLAVSYDITDRKRIEDERKRVEDERKRVEAALVQSRRQFEKIAATTPDLVYVFDLIEGRNTYVNAGVQQVLGYSPAQIAMIGSALIESLLHPDDIPGVIAGNNRLRELDEQGVYDHELRMRHATGEYRWLRCRESVFERTADGTVAQVIGTAQDVTERKRAEQALRESETKYRSLFSSIDEGFCTIEVLFDANEKPFDYRFLEANPAFERQTGLENAMGKTVREFVPQLEEFWFEIYGHIALTGEAQRFEHRADALGKFYDVYAFRIGDVIAHQVAILFHDISDRKRAEADRIQLIHEQASRLEAERLSQMKDEFLAMVSHELQSPMVAILGWTRLLRANLPTAAVVMKHLETIERNATVQAKLIQDLLDISRITAGKLRLSVQSVDLKSVIETAIATVAPIAQAKGVDLNWQTMDELDDFIVMGDRDRLQQIVSNLLTNAIKFTPTTGSITIELSRMENKDKESVACAEIRVIDTGIGISAAFLPYIFNRFQQAERSGSAGGLGLGLAIAHHFVELHNGTIEAQSAGEGQGATFVVRLPLVQPASLTPGSLPT